MIAFMLLLYLICIITTNNYRYRWRENIIHLEPGDYDLENYCIAVFDNRGSGQSFVSRGFITPKVMAHDTWELIIHELEWDKAHIMGQSMGGLIVQQMVQLYNERDQNKQLFSREFDVRSVTLFNTFISFYHVPYGLPLFSALKFILTMPLKMTPQAMTKALLQQMFSPNYFAANYSELEAKFRELPLSVNKMGAVKQLLGMITHYNSPDNFAKQFIQLNRPVLIICSTADAMVAHRNSLEMFRLIEDKQPAFPVSLEVIEDAGHICMAERANEVNNLIYKKWILKHC
jgi:pimeloyl-ACP methyl ester carboxylesterase